MNISNYVLVYIQRINHAATFDIIHQSIVERNDDGSQQYTRIRLQLSHNGERYTYYTDMSQSEPTMAVMPSSNNARQDKAVRDSDTLRSCLPSTRLYIFNNVSRLMENAIFVSWNIFTSVTSSLWVSNMKTGFVLILHHFQ